MLLQGRAAPRKPLNDKSTEGRALRKFGPGRDSHHAALPGVKSLSSLGVRWGDAQPECDRPVVDQRALHMRAELAAGDPAVARPGGCDELAEQAARDLGRSRR